MSFALFVAYEIIALSPPHNCCYFVRLLSVKFGDEVYSLSTFEGFKIESTTKEDDGSGFPIYRINGSKRSILFDPSDKTDIPDLHYSSFSGNYFADFSVLIQNRPVYYERNKKDDSTSGTFYYCDAEKSWVFTIKAFANQTAVRENTTTVIPQETIKRCENGGGWLMRSPITDAFLLDEVPTDSWSIWTGTLNVASDFSITCAECGSNTDCGLGINGKCKKKEGQKKGSCDCEEDYSGTFCNVEKPCRELAYFEGEEAADDALRPFQSTAADTLSGVLYNEKGVEAYDRYVCERHSYVEENTTSSNQQLTLFLVYPPIDGRFVLSTSQTSLFQSKRYRNFTLYRTSLVCCCGPYYK
jgi:hypothetical protein